MVLLGDYIRIQLGTSKRCVCCLRKMDEKDRHTKCQRCRGAGGYRRYIIRRMVA